MIILYIKYNKQIKITFKFCKFYIFNVNFMQNLTIIANYKALNKIK